MRRKSSCNPRWRPRTRRTLHQHRNAVLESQSNQGGKLQTPLQRLGPEHAQRKALQMRTWSLPKSSTPNRPYCKNQTLLPRGHRLERGKVFPLKAPEPPRIPSLFSLCQLLSPHSLRRLPSSMERHWLILRSHSTIDRAQRIVNHRLSRQ